MAELDRSIKQYAEKHGEEYGIDIYDLQDLNDMVAMPSWTPKQQYRTLEFAWRRLEHRVVRRRRQIFDQLELEQFHGNPDEEMQKRMNNVQLSKLAIPDTELDDWKRYVIIAELGAKLPQRSQKDRKKRREDEFTVLIPAHVDTFPIEPEHQADLHRLKEVHGKGPKKHLVCQGRGVYDMGLGVIAGMKYATQLQLPDNVRVYLAFTPDEEFDSAGARGLIEHWDRFPEVDMVLSHEIHSVRDRIDTIHRIDTARRGRAKFEIRIMQDAAGRSHGSTGSVGAPLIIHRIMDALSKHYPHTDEKKRPHNAPNHPILGFAQMQFEDGNSSQPSRGVQLPTEGYQKFSIQIVPPMTLEGVRDHVVSIVEQVEESMKWEKQGFNVDVGLNVSETSYEGYAMKKNHPFVQALRRGVSPVYKKYYPRRTKGHVALTGSLAVSDECLIARGLQDVSGQSLWISTDKAVVNMEILGSGAHGIHEVADVSDMGITVQAVQNFFTEELGKIAAK